MRLLVLVLLSSLLGLSFVAPGSTISRAAAIQDTPPPSVAGHYRPGAVLVKFKSGAGTHGRAALAAEGLEVTQEIPGLEVFEVAVPEGQEAATAERLSLQREVAYAELDYQATAQLGPNDPNYVNGRQWGLAQIGAAQAWNVTTGGSDTLIAVIDSGVDLAHPDLVSKLWKNAGEAVNGKDDDGNGYVDDIYGYRFYHAWNGSEYEPRADGQVKDDNGHGTHMAGIAGAATDNGVGVAGLSWPSPLMTVKVIDNLGNAWYSDIAEGILYAVDNGADIINLSLGGADASQVLCDAVSAAGAKGALLVAAAGNDGLSVFYPAMCPGALAVAATDRSDQRASFSNAGPRVDLAAPGTDIWSTWYTSGLGVSTYAPKNGTSQAAPFVSGAAALVWARWPALTARGVKDQLLGSVTDVGAPGKDDETGWGRLDAAAAVAAPVQPVDLHLDLSLAPQAVVAGNPLDAAFTATNAGAAAVTSVTIRASLPAQPAIVAVEPADAHCRVNGSEMVCGVSRLDAGATVKVSAVVTPTVVGDGQVTTTAAVSAAQHEISPADNQQAAVTSVLPALSGRVFLDANGDGILQAGETAGVADALLFLEQDMLPFDYRASQRPRGSLPVRCAAHRRVRAACGAARELRLHNSGGGRAEHRARAGCRRELRCVDGQSPDHAHC